MANGADIIIKGSSVDLDYDDTFYPRNGRKHTAHNKKITRITVADETDTIQFDSNENNSGLEWTITVYTGNS
jgi:hypothetical protein